MESKAKALLLFITSLLLIVTMSACSSSGGEPGKPTPLTSSARVDPLFEKFHASRGGYDKLGGAISDLLQIEDKDCQYVDNALMCHDPAAGADDGFSLSPAGLSLKIKDLKDTEVADDSMAYDNGFYVYPAFEGIRKELDAGKPISRFQYDQTRQRVVQYFENLGFYQLFDDPSGLVFLLPYGQLTCGDPCGLPPGELDTGSMITKNTKEAQFAEQLARLGDYHVFGRPLTKVYLADDGNEEQIYETVVLYAPPGNLEQIHFRPLSKILGLESTSPGPKKYDRRDNMIFYQINGEEGYHVPVFFDQFIWDHTSGIDLAGNPIDEVRVVKDGVARQNFQNLAIEFHKNAQPNLQVRLVPLGIDYYHMVGLDVKPTAEPSATPTLEPAPEEITETPGEVTPTETKRGGKTARPTKTPVPQDSQPENPPTRTPNPPPVEAPASGDFGFMLHEGFTEIPSSETQIIYILVYKAANLRPANGVTASLAIKFENGAAYNYVLGPTNDQGWASFPVPPMAEAADGQIVDYTVCLENTSNSNPCQSSSYLIWNER